MNLPFFFLHTKDGFIFFSTVIFVLQRLGDDREVRYAFQKYIILKPVINHY